jgi:hypothetical protein
MLAYDYPAMGIFWSMLYFFIFFMWIMLLFRVFADIFRSHDLGGFAKTLWFLFVIVVPFLGVFIYVIARGKSMSERDIAQAQAQQDAFASYVTFNSVSSHPGHGVLRAVSIAFWCPQLAAESSTVTLRSSAPATFCSVVSVAPTPPASRRATAAWLVPMRAASSR